MKAEPLRNKWKNDYFDAFKRDIKMAIEYLKQQFDEGVEYTCYDIDKALVESFPDIYEPDNISVCACGDKYTLGYSDERCDEVFCSKECADERANDDL